MEKSYGGSFGKSYGMKKTSFQKLFLKFAISKFFIFENFYKYDFHVFFYFINSIRFLYFFNTILIIKIIHINGYNTIKIVWNFYFRFLEKYNFRNPMEFL